jgi:streptomycin 6-kinase
LKAVPELDDVLRRRLARRFGDSVESWLDALPPVLSELAERWDVELESIVQRGSMSVVIRCRTIDGSPAVLKVSPDRERVVDEAAALARWRTVHVPDVLAFDEAVGALLIEAVEPGTPLVELDAYPPLEDVAALITSLHRDCEPDRTARPVAGHIAYLFDSGTKNYERRPDLLEVVPRSLYERGRQAALRLAADAPAAVLLHGDLTPSNVLDGGGRGLVAIDPAPCLGDPAFDAVDLVYWRAAGATAITTRAERLAPAIGADPERLLGWCSAFAAMAALEIAEASTGPDERVEPLLELAAGV